MCSALTMLVGLLTRACIAQDLPPPLTFHASFDGTLEAVARGNGTPVEVEGPAAYRPGKVGQALLCGESGALAYYAAEGNVRASSGTVEMWVCPLDWTGERDEFHVFFEARDPGWLLLYRYYQGGILTLMGADGSTYRSAAGPRLDWTPGEWHHLAGTWRAKGLEVYVDGERAGFCPDPPMPERLADSFRLGDHPWHVEREAQTLIDEVKVYAAPLDAESIARAARGEPIAWQPKPLVGLTVDPDRDTLLVECDAAGMVGDMGPGRTARVTLQTEVEGRRVAEASIDAFEAEVGRCDFDVAEVEAGEYTLRAEVLDEAGEVVASASEPFVKPGPPVWSGNDLGMEDEVLPPWTPLKAEGANGAVECWGRAYQFDGLLAQARSTGVDLLSEPVQLVGVLDQGETFGRVEGSITSAGMFRKAATATDTRHVILDSGNLAGPMMVDIRHEIEYDGFTWTDLTLDAGEGTKVEELRLTWSMPASEATLMHADRMKWIGNPAGALDEDGWSSEWTHFLWLGNEERGLAWYAESDRNWVSSTEKPAIEVRPEGDQVRVTIRLIAEPTELKGKVEYGFGMMATPVRPRPADARRWRMAPGVRPTFRIIWPNGNMKWYGHTEPIDPARFAEEVKASQAQGCRVVPYVNLNFASAGVPEWGYYQSRWGDGVRAVTPSDVAAMGHASMGTCPNVRDWQDYILYRVNEMIDRYEVDGIYIDCWSPYPCTVGGCGWTDEAGKVHPTRPIRAYREIIRRVYALFAERRPDPLLMVHMSSQVDIPMLSFTHTILDGEQFRSGDLAEDYLDLLPADMFRAEFMGKNWGPVAFFLPEFGEEYKAVGTPNLAAYLFLHDVNAWPIWSEVEPWNRLYEAADAFGIAEAEFLPYWQGSGVRTDAQVLVSAYVRDGKAMLAVMNTGEATEARLMLDLQRLGMRQVTEARDVIRDEAMSVDGETVAIPLERRQGRVLNLSAGD